MKEKSSAARREEETERASLGLPARWVGEGETYRTTTETICDIVLTRRHPLSWMAGLGVGTVLVMVLCVSVAWLFLKGVGVWGINIPVAWGFAIVNFVWWIGIGHAGTFISAILLLLFQKWRTSINRFTEAMTLFAVACAGLFPLLHLGRPHVFYWSLPYPNTMGLWPQFRSPLIWDIFAVGTYFTVSLMFWYLGLVPDLASVRDRAKTRGRQVVYGFLALGWRGSARHWLNHQKAYLLLAGLATPLVVSVHSVVSFDFAVAIVPGWHSTIFPPFFVAGAIFSGFAMVLNIVIPIRKIYRLEAYITTRHLNNMANILLATGLMVAFGYLMENFMAWYSGDVFERSLLSNRAGGPYRWVFWAMMLCNVAAPQALWSRGVRTTPWALFTVALFVNVGMWMERFVIVIGSLHRDYLPSSWDMFAPTGWDWATLFGSVGLFLVLLFLFIRFLPMISMFELKELIGEEERK